MSETPDRSRMPASQVTRQHEQSRRVAAERIRSREAGPCGTGWWARGQSRPIALVSTHRGYTNSMICTGAWRAVVFLVAAATIVACSGSSKTSVVEAPVSCSFAMVREYAIGGTGGPTEKTDRRQTLTACKSRVQWLAEAKRAIAQGAAPSRSGIAIVGGVSLHRRGATLHNTPPDKLLTQFCKGNEALPACNS